MNVVREMKMHILCAQPTILMYEGKKVGREGAGACFSEQLQKHKPVGFNNLMKYHSHTLSFTAALAIHTL